MRMDAFRVNGRKASLGPHLLLASRLGPEFDRRDRFLQRDARLHKLAALLLCGHLEKLIFFPLFLDSRDGQNSDNK